MHRVFTMEVEWDGARLVARTMCRDGWRLLANAVPPRPHTHEVPCLGLEDLTTFELGVFMAHAARDFTYDWEMARQDLVDQAQMFERLPGDND